MKIAIISFLITVCCSSSFSNVPQDMDRISSSVIVGQSCRISGIQNIDFGTIDGNFTSHKDSNSGSISVTCTLGTTYSIGLGDGNNGLSGQRRMMSSDLNTFINYDLYSDSAFTSAWGDIGSGHEKVDTGNGTSQTHTIYARIPSAQPPVAAGIYSDTIIATLTF